MKSSLFKIIFLSIIFVMSFTMNTAADTNHAYDNLVDDQATNELKGLKQKQLQVYDDSDQIREVIDELITVVSNGNYDREEAGKMVERINGIHSNLRQGLIDNGIIMFLVDFPITELEEFSHLKGEVPRGWEDTGKTWDDVPGAGGKPSVARIGYSNYGEGHSSVNLELHEIAHPIDGYVLNYISNSSAFLEIHAEEQPSFLPDVYFEYYPSEYFAEAFAYYFLNDATNAQLKEEAPKTHEFIKNLGPVESTKDSLNEAIEEAQAFDEAHVTPELTEALEHAIAVYNNPDATQEEINEADTNLRRAIKNALPQVEEVIDDLITIVTKGDYDREEALKMVHRIQSIHANLLRGLVEHDVVMKLVNFQITELAEYEYLKGEVPRGWEGTGLTWDDVPGAGGQTSVARIGYSDHGMGHSAINLELHEIAHPIDHYVLDDISSSDSFLEILAEEQPIFLPNVYFEYPEEYFAEAFAYYFLNDETNAELKESAPKTYAFIKNLGIITNKESLNEAIEEAKAIDKNLVTPALEEALANAIRVSEDPNATQEEVDQAEAALRTAIKAATKVPPNPANKDALNKAIKEAKAIDKKLVTTELTEALAIAIRVSEDVNATQKEVDDAEASLLAAITTAKEAKEKPPVEKDTDNKETDKNEGTTVDKNKQGKPLPSTATNMYTHMLIGLILTLLGGLTLYSRKLRLAK